MEIMGECTTRAESFSIQKVQDTIYVGVKDGLQALLLGDEGIYNDYVSDYATECIRHCEPYLYTLQRKEDHWMFVVFISKGQRAKQIISWDHDDNIKLINQFAVHNDIIYTPNRCKNSIQQYTVHGKSAGEDIAIKLAKSNTFVCIASHGLLVISQTSPPMLACLNPQTAQQLWRKTDMMYPQAIAADFYSSKDAMIAVYSEDVSSKRTFLDMRDSQTGT